MDFQMSNIDLVFVVIYILAILFWAFKNANNSDSESYFLAGRNMSWKAVGLSLFAASVSSTTLIGQSAEGFKTGLAVYNYQWVSILVMIFFAAFFLPFYIKSGVYTMPEFLEKRYDKRPKTFFSIITIIGNVFLDAAAALYSGALIIRLIFPEAELSTIIYLMAIIAGSYTIFGGLSSAINAELVQAVILIIGSIILSYLCFAEIGGWEVLMERFNEGMWLHLVRPMDDATTPWLGIILGIPVLGFYFWGNNQVMVQRVLSAKSIEDGRKGVLFVGFLYIFTLFIFIFPGLCARLMDLFDVQVPLSMFGNEVTEIVDVNEIYPRLIMSLMPIGLMGIIMAAMISALTSTLSASINSASTLLTMDFYSNAFPNTSKERLVRVGQIISVIILIIAAIWAPNIQKFGSLVDYYQEMASYLAPPIVTIFFLGLFWKRANANGAFATLLVGALMAVLLLLFKNQTFLADVHFLLMVPILVSISVMVCVAASLATAKPSSAQLEGNLWSIDIWHQETKELENVKWFHNFRIQALILAILAILSFIIFL
ncbi:sodium:solute symporter [Flammeovirga yaeyamensis]|uniref:Sodium:solute symporter n=1 Tax=Flammeovirga yaeyamensis TaxID=367791 RepID=A0AAX1N229_9BACT|nr:sodium:solute symporter [Flammeovirga yaeyamensis]MBB3698239.1 SSS family solute:Na+ symporter [Flammeovirga yaeyamensis]QWG01386.1 sodium:solute symporter [Flammeovirga yaeyamensis]